MLQWMGGSRRKVNASRKSIHNKQKQYFEQRKRQQQAFVQENQTDTMKEDNYLGEPRSLDILNLVNLAMSHNQDCAHQVNEISLPAPRKEVVCQYPNASGSEPEQLSMKLSPASGSTHYYAGKTNEVKIPALSGGYNVEHTNFESNEQKEEVQNEGMILDLLIGDAEDIKPKARSTPENHVAFAVEGLGKVGMETPAHSPNVHKRGFPSPPRLLRHAYSSIKYKARPYDLGTHHDSSIRDMNNERYGNETNFLYNSREEVDEISSKKSTRVGGSHVFPDVFADLFDNPSDDTEGIYCESRNGSKTYTDCHDARKQNRVWGNDTFPSESFLFISSDPTSFEIYEPGISSDCFQFGRTAQKGQNTFDTSDCWKFSPSDPFPSILPEDDNNHLSFDWDSDKKVNTMSGMKSMFDSWSFPELEESHDCRSLLSEESCSSTAGGIKAKESKKSTMNDLAKTLGEKFNSRNIANDVKGYSSISGASCKRNQEEMNKDSMPDYFASKSSSYLGRAFASTSLDTECISPAKETVALADMTSTPCCFNCNGETNTTSSRSKLNSEPDPFDMSSVPKSVPFVGTKSKSATGGEHLGSFHLDEPRQSSVSTACLQKTAVCLSLTKSYSPSLSSAKVQHISPTPDISGLGNPKNTKKEEYGSTGKPVLSLTGAVDCNESSNDHQKSSHHGELSFAPKDRKSDEADSYMVLENSAKFKSVTSDRPARLDGSPCAPSKIGNEGSIECIQGNRSTHQVTLESYVLQFLCVQKVLLEASAKDA